MTESVISLALGEYLGTVTRREVLGGVVLAETMYGPDTYLAPHRHEGASLFLVVSGTFRPHSGYASQRLSAGAVSFHRPDEVHGGTLQGRGPRGFNVELTPVWTEQWGAEDAVRRPAAAFSAAASYVPQLMSRLRYELRSNNVGRELAVQGLALELTVALAREVASARRSQRALRTEVDRAADVLRSNVSVPRWDVVASALGVPPATLARAFRAHIGCTPAAYVRRVRLEAATEALATTSRPLGRIAVDAGFYDQAHFTRAFRAAFGVPPSAYRRVLRGE